MNVQRTAILSALMLMVTFQEYLGKCPTFVGNYRNQTFTSRDKGSCYILILVKKTWKTANRVCMRAGWQLIKIESKNETKLLELKYNERDEYFWIGLTDRRKEGTLQWTDGSPLSYSELPGMFFEKLELALYDCLAASEMKFTEGMTWAFKDCHNKYYFVCKTVALQKTIAPATEKTDSSERSAWKTRSLRRPSTVVAEQAHLRDIRLLTPPDFIQRSNLVSNCIRLCMKTLSPCRVVNFDKNTNECRGFSSLDVLHRQKDSGDNWAIWTIQ